MDKLISGMGSDQVKVITGIRRCGKSFLLFNLFKSYLLSQGVPEGNVIEMAFDKYRNKKYQDPEVFYPYMIEELGKAKGKRYVLLDEVQLLGDFSEVLIDLIGMPDVDVYVTGSNARLLSKDVVTEFRGRGQKVEMAPLSFSEFMSAYSGDKREGYVDYATYGGLPAILSKKAPSDKAEYLRDLYDELYLSDIIERNDVRDPGNLEDLVDVLSSAIGSLVNPLKLSSTFKSEKRVTIAPETIERYISLLEDAFLIRPAKRYDLKGRRYIGTPYKLYFSDLGLRNARMNFRQMEETHIMENVIYNELVARGYGVDVGVVPSTSKGEDGKAHRVQLEIDFVCNKGSKRYYIQSAFALPTAAKWEREQRSLLKVDDGFKKIVVTKEGLEPHYNENGILVTNIYDFLLDKDSLDS
ncbi:MAG: ATP-binding protein [Atopobiaceae bacterium]|nr:ATP-binding protein [Atopobiaceae bacterium]